MIYVVGAVLRLWHHLDQNIVFQVKSDSEAKVKPFTKFVDSGAEDGATDYNDPSLVGLNFYSQYGQHDDRPLRLKTTSAPVKVKLLPTCLLSLNNAACKKYKQPSAVCSL